MGEPAGSRSVRSGPNTQTEMTTAGLVLGICGGGGNDTVARVFVLIIVVVWVLAVAAILGGETGRDERLALLAVLAGTIAIGGLVFLAPEGVSGNGDYLGRFLLSLLLSAALGVGGSLATRRYGPWRGLFIAIAGDVFIPGGLILLLFASVGLGSGCLD